MRTALLLLIPATMLVSSVAEAADTGSARGRVNDADGNPVPGATITVSGPNIAGEIVVETDSNGTFRFLSLPPGTHEMTVSKSGFASSKYEVSIRLNESAFVPVVLKVSSAMEEILVEETLPVIDSTKSSVSTQLSADLIQNLPVGRSYQDAVQLVPGVSGRVDTTSGGPGNGNPSVRGEGQYGNSYFVDGISTRDPATKTFGANVNFDAIEEIQVYTDGVPAEFSQATGMLVNVVTKDGGDEHHGSVGYYANFDAAGGQYLVLDLDTGEEVMKDKRNFFNHELSATAGGPIAKEKLWYFAAVDLGLQNIEYENSDPDYPYQAQDADGFGKITWFATPDVTLQYQIGYGASNIDNYDTSGLFDAATAQNNYKKSELTNIVTARWRPTDLSELEIKASSLNLNLDVVPMSGDADIPQIVDLDTGKATQNWSDFDYNQRSRLGGGLSFTQLVNDVLGDHRFKAGADYWKLNDSRELQFTGGSKTVTFTDIDTGEEVTETYDGVAYNRQESAGFACTPEADYADCQGFTGYKNVGALGHQGNIFSAYLQDDWRPVEPLTLNLGVRLDHEQLLSNVRESVGDDDVTNNVIVDAWMPAPRLGAAWDITNDSKTVLTVNAGRYYDLNGNTFADWGDTRSAFDYSEFDWDNPSDFDGDGVLDEYAQTWHQDPAGDPLIYCNDYSIDAIPQDVTTDEDGNEVLTWDTRDAAIEACGGQNTLRPYHMDKLVVGIEREIMPLFALGIKAIVSETVDLPEDINYNLDMWVIANPESKRRDYRAIELTAERKYDGVWQLLASYTLSESKGTSPGQFELSSGGQSGSNGNGVGVFLDDTSDKATREGLIDVGAGWLVDGLAGLGTTDNDAGYYGYLPYHSFHNIKLSGSYSLPFGTTLGAVYEFDSGHAWQKRGMVDLYGDYFAFPEGRGSRFMPAVHYFDLRAAHRFDLGGQKAVEVAVDVFNVLDLDSPITYYENDNESFGLTMYRQAPRAIRAGAKFTY